ncbi:hypothetical protein PBI_THONKO_61 [Mycobacterium phage Thonko]|uniref:Uncharacterized protein n=1 Tax=Mycobacterium phage Thonko TaxID=2282910 RepID=A0A346FCA8_9CAUD|nr:hypothetical protein I5G57_gp061 [Mycobacterium phage Thonko]AXN53333.1 hypothetical protein PBI_THONKO_61 [Mycobacterium phage Thonko]
MPTPDEVPDELREQASAVADQMTELVRRAHARGARDGMELAAVICQQVIDGAEHEIIVTVASTLRDQIRLGALSIE